MTIIVGVLGIIVLGLLLATISQGIWINTLEKRQRWHKLEIERIHWNQTVRDAKSLDRLRSYPENDGGDYWYG